MKKQFAKKLIINSLKVDKDIYTGQRKEIDNGD